MPRLHVIPNVEYLHTIEDEIYEYAVNHPKEDLSRNLEEGSIGFVYKMGMLYRFGEYNKTACEERNKLRTGEGPTLFNYVKEFVNKFPQWERLYYY